MRLRKVKLGDITSKIGSGATPRGGKNSYGSSGISLIRSMNVYDFTFDMDQLAYINQKQADELSNVVVQEEDVLLNITGASVARCCIVPSKVLPARVNQHVAIIRVDKHFAIPRFVFYYLVCPSNKHEILNLAQGGATREALTKSTIENFRIELPTIETQTRIASILSAYDDLIENNTRRIQILEQMAQTIYKEWFVNFRFPGHENTKFIDSLLGNIPEGWEVKTVKDLYDTSSGGTPSRTKPEYFENGNINWLKTKELNDSFIFATEEKINESGLKNSSAKLFPPFTVIIALYGATIGKLGILSVESSSNQACCALLTRDNYFSYAYIFLYLLHNRNKIIELRQGAAQQNISQELVRDLVIFKPPNKVMDEFNSTVIPTFKMISNLQLKNNNLRRTRDLLLPKLMNGEIEV